MNPLDRRNQRARPAPLRIMTYNVHRCVGADGRADPRRIAEVIAACQPDMVALQVEEELCCGLTIFFAADRLTCSASRCREASSSAERRITCRWSWTSALSNMSGLGCQQRPMTVLVFQRGAILPW